MTWLLYFVAVTDSTNKGTESAFDYSDIQPSYVNHFVPGRNQLCWLIPQDASSCFQCWHLHKISKLIWRLFLHDAPCITWFSCLLMPQGDGAVLVMSCPRRLPQVSPSTDGTQMKIIMSYTGAQTCALPSILAIEASLRSFPVWEICMFAAWRVDIYYTEGVCLKYYRQLSGSALRSNVTKI